MTTALARYTPPEADRGDILWDPDAYDHAIKVAGNLAASGMLPLHFKGKPADVLIALQIARRTGSDPFTVMQSIYIVGGRPGWLATYMIALANRSGFPIRWKVERRAERLKFKREQWHETERGKKVQVEATMPDLTVTAYSPGGDEDMCAIVDSRMAIDEGWANNPKYSTLGEQMLRYRAATLLVRLYRPELLLGLPTTDEAEDITSSVETVETPPSPTAPNAPAPPRGLAAVNAALGADDPAPAASAPPAKVEDPPKPPAKPKPTPEQAADILRRAFEVHAVGHQMPMDDARKAARAALDVRSFTEAGWVSMMKHGAAQGWWHSMHEGNTLVIGPVPALRVSEEPRTDSDIVVPDPWVDEDGVALPVGPALVSQLAAVANHLNEQYGPEAAIAATKRALERAGIPKVDGASEPALRRYFVALGLEVEGLDSGSGK